jgi:RNA polymerase sigma-70 factor (ECF subfamily)
VDENDAIQRLKAGDIAGLQALVEMYQAEAVQAACLITGDLAEAEDVVQTLFVRAYEKIQGFDEARPFRPWFLRMVVNEALKQAGRSRRRVSLDEDEAANDRAVLQRLDMTTREPEDAVQRTELIEEMRLALDRLSPAQRAAVVLHDFLGLSTAEAAGRLNCAPATLRWHLSAARARLRALLTTFK